MDTCTTTQGLDGWPYEQQFCSVVQGSETHVPRPTTLQRHQSKTVFGTLCKLLVCWIACHLALVRLSADSECVSGDLLPGPTPASGMPLIYGLMIRQDMCTRVLRMLGELSVWRWRGSNFLKLLSHWWHSAVCLGPLLNTRACCFNPQGAFGWTITRAASAAWFCASFVTTALLHRCHTS